jgi:signal transduction histidine kinase
MNIDGLVSLQPLHAAIPFVGHSAEMSANGGISVSFPDALSSGFAGPPAVLNAERVAERAIIAQELHDTLLQGFLAASMQLHMAVDRLPEDCTERVRLKDVARLVDQTLEESRWTLQGLRSNKGRTASLGEALARVPSDLGLPTAHSFRVVVLGTEQNLRAGLRDDVYSICREAIVNAWRHSRATAIEAEIEFRPTELRVAVRDNGCGIGAQNVQSGPAGHWGLQGMRERADRIGARLRLWSKVAMGTEIELRVPGQVAFEPMTARAAR